MDLKQEENQVNWGFLVMLGILAAALVPLFAVSFYNFRSVDDFSYSQTAEKVWEESGSVLKVLFAQISYTVDYWKQWQGTFFSEWITTSLMGIFSKQAYYMSTWITLGGFLLAEGFLFDTVFVKVLGADRRRSGIVTMGCMLLQVLLVPFPNEAFFWFCGAMLYTFIHALAMVLCALWIRFGLAMAKKAEKKNVLRERSLGMGVLLLSAAVAGSNYITALTILLLYVLCCAWFVRKKNRGCKWIFLCFGLYVGAFLLNVLAPGNMVRQDASGVSQMGAVKSILLSLKEAMDYLMTWTIAPVVIMGILFLPLFWNMVQRRSFRYPWPLLVSLLSFGIYAAQFTPTLYALGIIGAGRVQNLYRLNLFLLLYGNELYWIGWLRNRLDRNGEKEAKVQKSYFLPGLMVGLFVLLYSLSIWGGSTLTSVSAFQSLRRGEAKQYWEENEARLEILEDASLRDVVLKPFAVKPYVLFFGDIVEDPEDWVNQHMAEYYGKDSVTLEKKTP